MAARHGVVMLLFDLPVKKSGQRRAYTQFRKAIIRRGYRFFQESVYIKLIRNVSFAGAEKYWLEQNAPLEGRVHMMDMNLTEFRTLTAIRGNPFDIEIFADDIVFVGQETKMEISDDELIQMEEAFCKHKAGMNSESQKDREAIDNCE